jgi:glyoxylase-like metal-dependent hydrolase (beta-lactamase superfamily II)/rhodanese-related sulfurtransferase
MMEIEPSTAVTAASQVNQEVPSQISVGELFQWISRPNDLFLLDVRNEEDFNAWRIESRFTPQTLHLFYGDVIEDEDTLEGKVPENRPVVVLCAKGGASDYVAEILRNRFGISAMNVAGGMLGWGNFYRIQPVDKTERYQVYQVSRPARGCLSYILVSKGQAVIVDPLRHTGRYLDFLKEKNASLRMILDTHAHADHISGGPDLAKATGAPYYLHPYDGIHPFDMLPAKISYEMLRDEQSFELGHLSLQVIHTPGHTLGQVNFLATDGDRATFLFSGDNLFVQSFGRPDLGGQGRAWAPLVYDTIFRQVKQRVPEQALVLPGHFASMKEAGDDGLFSKRLSSLWHENSDLQITDPAAFIDFVLSHLPQMPEQYIEIKRVNAGWSSPDEEEASELELGKNICALSTAY